jgi:hypothetical protein
VRERYKRGVVGDRGVDLRIVDGEAVGRAHNVEVMARVGLLQRALEDIQVRWEVEIVAHNLGAARTGLQRSAHKLEQVDGGRIADDHLIGLRADQLCDLRADALRRLEPALAPAANEALAPLLLHRFAHAGCGKLGQASERVAIEVDDVWIGDHKCITKSRQRIVAVLFVCIGHIGWDGHAVAPPG